MYMIIVESGEKWTIEVKSDQIINVMKYRQQLVKCWQKSPKIGQIHANIQ